jgi:WD40 repeat protein
LATLRGHKWGINQTAFSPNGKLLVSGAIDNTARIWDLAAKREVAVLQGHKCGIHSVAFSPDGKTIATGSTDETVKLWNAATGQQLMTLREFKEDLGSLLFSPDGTTLAAGRATFKPGQRTVQLWRATSFPEIEAAEAKEKTENKQP